MNKIILYPLYVFALTIFFSLSSIATASADCLFFNGVDSFVEVQDNQRLRGGPGRSLAVEAWVFPTAFPENGQVSILSKYLDWNSKDWGLIINSEGIIGFQKETWAEGAGPRGNWYVWSSPIPLNQWSHVAFVFDNDRDIVEVYVNGQVTGSREFLWDLPATSAVVWFGGSGPFYYPHRDSRLFSGYIDEVRVWDRARTQAEIYENMLRCGIVGADEALVAYWDGEPDSDLNILYDRSGNANHGTLFNVTWSENNAPCLLKVLIDIKPGSYPNSINLTSRGVVPVAILTTAYFDANTVDPDTVLFAGASPVRWNIEDIDGDGYIDMVLHFNTQDLLLNNRSTAATLTGMTLDGWYFEGTDSVNIVPKGKGKK